MIGLLMETAEDCTLLNKVRVQDGYGGWKTVWQDGPTFKCSFSFDNSLQARRASKEGVKDLYTLTTEKNITLSHDDVIRRKEDGLTYRITSNGKDKKTPDSAWLDMRVVTAEQWDLPNDEEEQNG